MSTPPNPSSPPYHQRWHPLEKVLWSSLANGLITDELPPDRRLAALKWLGECIGKRPEKRGSIVRALEDLAATMLESAQEHPSSFRAASGYIRRLRVPMSHPEVLPAADYTWRRMASAVGEMEDGGFAQIHYSVKLAESEESREFHIEEDEVERVAADIFFEATIGRPDAIRRVGLTAVRFGFIPDGADIGLPMRTPLFALVLRDDERIREPLFDHLLTSLALVDPPLLLRLLPLRESILSNEEAERSAALGTFAADVLRSWTFELHRDLAHAVSDLRSKRLSDLQAIVAPVGPILQKAQEALPSSEVVVTEGSVQLPVSSLYALWVLKASASPDGFEVFLPQLTIDREQAEAAETDYHRILTDLAYRTATVPDVFTSLWLLLALIVACEEPTFADHEIVWLDRTMRLTEWVRWYIASLLQRSAYVSSDSEVADLVNASFSGTRAHNHAATLRIAAWAVASPIHLHAMLVEGEKSPSETAQGLLDVDGNVLVQTLVLSSRILPLITRDLSATPDDAKGFLSNHTEKLGVPQRVEGWPDAFNPFLYGPEEYDHEIGVLLSLLTSSWVHLTASKDKPEWWSESSRDALCLLAERDIAVEEALIIEAVDAGIPNRLGTPLTEPVPALAQKLLELATDSHSKRIICETVLAIPSPYATSQVTSPRESGPRRWSPEPVPPVDHR